MEEEAESVVRPVERQSPGGERQEEDVGQRCRHVDGLARPADALAERDEEEGPGDEEADGQLPLDVAQLARSF